MNRVFLGLLLMVGVVLYFMSTKKDAAQEVLEPVLSAPAGAQVAAMTSDLRTLVNVQMMYQVLEGSFAGQFAALEFSPSNGVSIRIIEASADGFSAEATHPSLPNWSCVVFVGSVTAPTTLGGLKAASARTPFCDG